MATKKTNIELAVKLTNLTKVKQQIDSLFRDLKNQSKKSSNLPILKGALLGLTNGIHKVATDFGRTLKSAMMRTLAYSIVNMPKQLILAISSSLRELGAVDLNIARAASILGVKTGEAAQQMNTLYKAMANAAITGHMNSSQFSQVAFSLSLAGLKAAEFNQALNVVDKLSLISGESANNLSFNFLKLARAFGITGADFKKLGDALAAGMTTSLSKMSDFLDAAKYLGPMWKQAYGGGIQSAKDFIAVTAALNDQAIRSTTGARGLATAILKLMTPSSKATALLARYNINLFESTGNSYRYASALRRLQRDYGELIRKEHKLTLERAKLISRGIKGEALTKNSEKLNELQLKETQLVKEINMEYDRFIKAGGKLKRPIGLVKEFNKALKEGKMSSTGFAQLLKNALGIRSSRSLLGLTNGVDILIKKIKEQERAQHRIEKLYKNIDSTFGGILLRWQNSLDKFKKLLDKVFLTPPFQAFYQLFTKYVLDPFNKFLTSETAIKFHKSMLKLFTKMFTPSATAANNLITLLTEPQTRGLKRGTGEYRKALTKALQDVGKNISPIFKGFIVIFTKIFFSIGSKAASAFFQGFVENFPIIKFLKTTAARIQVYQNFVQKSPLGALLTNKTRSLYVSEAQKALAQYNNNAYLASKNLTKVPEKWREAAIQSALMLKKMGLSTTGKVGWQGMELTSLKKPFSLANNLSKMIDSLTKGIPTEKVNTPIEQEITKWKKVYGPNGVFLTPYTATVEEIKKTTKQVKQVVEKKTNEVKSSLEELGNTITNSLKEVDNSVKSIKDKIRINQRTGGA